MLTIDHTARRAAALTILRSHTDAELARILVSCEPDVAAECRAYLARHGRPVLSPASRELRASSGYSAGGSRVF